MTTPEWDHDWYKSVLNHITLRDDPLLLFSIQTGSIFLTGIYLGKHLEASGVFS